MLTITTNKEEVAGIAAGVIKEKALPLTDFWEKRILNLLGFSDTERREIIHNLREDRKGTTDARREVRFTAGGAATVRIMATFRIGRINPEAAETFIVTIVEILEAAGLEAVGAAVPKINGEVVEAGEAGAAVGGGMPNAPAVRVISKHMGFCRFCNQANMFDAPDGLTGEDYNELATQECDCTEAQTERRRRARMEAAGAWAKNVFSQSGGQLQLMLCAIRATFDGNVDYITVKIGKNTHRVDVDGDGMIRIKTSYRDSNEETF
ncbi:MAG: hypothetical protein NC548_26550 [Lachnospiraceae bacterium]|nr:hypothetical protein [Lachnospiraceae bacterium]